MPYYKDTNNQLHFLDSAEFAYVLPAGCVEITDAEAESIQAAQAAAQAAAQTALPNPTGFAQAVKTGLGGIVAANSIAVAYPLFFAAISSGEWADVQALILDAQSKAVINSTQYANIKAAATANNIPITLA